jgi:hypothetical protein
MQSISGTPNYPCAPSGGAAIIFAPVARDFGEQKRPFQRVLSDNGSSSQFMELPLFGRFFK